MMRRSRQERARRSRGDAAALAALEGILLPRRHLASVRIPRVGALHREVLNHRAIPCGIAATGRRRPAAITILGGGVRPLASREHVADRRAKRAAQPSQQQAGRHGTGTCSRWPGAVAR
jgi:hypothetical protein